MNNKSLSLIRSVVLMIFGCLILLTACSNEPLKVDSITLLKDDGAGKAGAAAQSLNPADHVFHVNVQLNRIETNLKAQIGLVAVDTSDGTKDKQVVAVDLAALAGNTLTAKFSLPNDWPTGKYRLDVTLNGTFAKSLEFTINAP